MRKYLILLALIMAFKPGRSQFATFDAVNAAAQYENIANTLAILKQAKDAIEYAKKQYQTALYLANQAKKTAELLQAVADDKVDFTIIKIIASFKTGIGECSNYNNYINTYAGIQFKMAEGYYGNDKGVGGKMADLKRDEIEAEKQANVFTIVNDRTKLEIGYKYLDISDDLLKKTEELSKALDSDDLKISKAERLQFKLACTDYQLKSMDYKLKGMNLIAEASQYSERQNKVIEAQKSKMAFNQWLKLSK